MRYKSYSSLHNIQFAGFQSITIEGDINIAYYTSARLLVYIALLEFVVSIREYRVYNLVSPEDLYYNYKSY